MSRIDKAIELAANKKQGAVFSGKQEPMQRDPVDHTIASAGYDQLAPMPINDPLFAPLVDPGGFAAEQYKKLRAMLIRKTNRETFENCLLVTSAVAGEGKSLTTMNLALSLARATDYSVVLVDTDLRNPQLHRMLGLEPEFGLVHYLRDGVQLEDIMHKVGLGNLCLIPAGESVQEPLELLTSKRMRALMTEIKGRYHDRYVLLDTPPILPFADVRVLGEMVDNTIFVCREGYSNRDQIKQGLEAMSDFSLLGIVCNDMRLSAEMDYSNYYGIK